MAGIEWTTKYPYWLVALTVLVCFQVQFAGAEDFAQLRSAAERGDAAAHDRLRHAAEQGEAEAQWGLGRMYDYGRGVAQNHREAARWYRKAAEQGHATAQHNLGWMYATGKGVEQNDLEAEKWLRRAAQPKSAKTQNHPAFKDRQSEGIVEEVREAEKRYRRPAKPADAAAQNRLPRAHKQEAPKAQDNPGRAGRQGVAARSREMADLQVVTADELCHKDLKSIVVDSDSRDLAAEKSLYYDHIYQYVEEYPYWKYVGGGLIGIAYRKNVRSGNMAIEGSTDAEGENHVALHLSGTGNLDGIPLKIGMADGAFGYLMVPSTAENRHATFLDIGSIRVLTTMAGGIVEVPRRNVRGNSLSFLKVTPRRENPLGTALIRRSPSDRWWGIERRYMEGGETVYERPDDKNLWLRTISASQVRTVEIAGRQRRQRVLCRYKYGPIAATNDERFRPRIERELDAWAARHRAATQAKKRAEEVIHFVEVPRELGREFRVRGRCGVVELKFPTNSSAIRTVDRRWSTTLLFNKPTYAGYFQVHGDLLVNGARFPKSVRAPLRASFRSLTSLKVEKFRKSAEILDLLRKREFSSRVEWVAKEIDRDCDWAPEGTAPSPDTCWLRAKRQVLERSGCDL